MQDTDKIRFLGLFAVLDAFYGKTTSKEVARIYWSDLREYSIDDVERAAAAHRKDPERCSFFPKSGDLIRQINGLASQDGRLDWAESFAICVSAASEDRTVVWSAEMRSAWFAVYELYEIDKIAAKQSFRSIYERLVAGARALGCAVAYSVSLGGSESHQREMVERAVACGQLSHESALKIFPALVAPVASNVVLLPAPWRSTAVDIKARLAELRAALECKKEGAA